MAVPELINYDLENSPLQIKTNSMLGSDEKVHLYFRTAKQELRGGVRIYFTSPPQYELTWCTFETDFDTELPDETDKVWTITLSKPSGEIHVVITCNNVKVLNVVFSDTTCTRPDWSKDWDGDVEKIIFSSCCDTATDYYRLGWLIPKFTRWLITNFVYDDITIVSPFFHV